MPQLDLLTFSIQISVMFFFGWNLLSTIINLILPQYILTNFIKIKLWFYLNSVIIFTKFYNFIIYADLISYLTHYIKKITLKIKFIKLISNNFYKNMKIKKRFFKFQNLFFKLYSFKKINLLNNNVFLKEYLIILGQSTKLNFFFKKSLIYIFIQKYKLNFFNKFNFTERKLKRVTLKKATRHWCWDDNIYLKIKKKIYFNKKLIFKI